MNSVSSRAWITSIELNSPTEERAGRLDAVEMKWLPKPGLRAPRAWREAYPDITFRVVDRESYLEFITSG
ncbi:MAG: hypothetical protein F4137_18950 [Acidobacteria bacterium]|nr:hypothetical protein [Acidobacteriota bacterium]